MVKDLQIMQVLACDLMLHVGNVCVFFSLHAAMFLGMDCLGFWYFVVVSCVNVMKYKFYNMWDCWNENFVVLCFCLMYTDTENIKLVFCAVKDTIMQSALKEFNLA